MLLLLFLLFVDHLPISHVAHLIFMAISVCHLREPFIAEFTLVRGLPTVHVDVILDVVELGVRLATVLALKQLVGPSGAEIGLEPLDVAAVVAVGVDTLFSVHFCRVNVGLFVGDILLEVKDSLYHIFGWSSNVLRQPDRKRLIVIRKVDEGVHLGGHLAYEGN